MDIETVVRKAIIYHTKVERDPGAYAATPVVGCSHGCRFPCYAYLMARRFGKAITYEEWCKPKLISNALQLAQEQLPKIKDKASYIHFSYATDPFMYEQPEVIELTLKLMQLINAYDIPVHILTKGIILNEAFALSKQNVFGITLVSLADNFHAKYEPGSAPYKDRIAALRRAHKKGFKTFVNIEPYPTPNIFKQSLLPILEAVDFVDTIRLGQLNYNDLLYQYRNWQAFYQKTGIFAKTWCLEHKISYEGIAEEETTVKEEIVKEEIDYSLLPYTFKD
jgi:DNA repair photolyase